jgi:pyruvate carboxylase subunit B
VLLGRWKKMNDGYGKAVLGYFGRPPLEPDPEVVKIAAEQLGKPPFKGDPLEAAPDSLGPAREALVERGLAPTEENIFLVAAAIIPGKNMELNEGIRLLTKKAKIVLPLKKKEEPKPAAAPAPAAPAPAGATATGPAMFTSPVTTTCTVVEGGSARNFTVTIEPPNGGAAQQAMVPAAASTPPAPVGATATGKPVFSPFDGKAELVEVKVGDAVAEGQVVACVEAMKAKHDVKAPCGGKVTSVDAGLGDDVMAGKPILHIGG